jgi:hypothetical protein
MRLLTKSLMINIFFFLSSITVNCKLDHLFVRNEGKNYIYVLKY